MQISFACVVCDHWRQVEAARYLTPTVPLVDQRTEESPRLCTGMERYHFDVSMYDRTQNYGQLRNTQGGLVSQDWPRLNSILCVAARNSLLPRTMTGHILSATRTKQKSRKLHCKRQCSNPLTCAQIAGSAESSTRVSSCTTSSTSCSWNARSNTASWPKFKTGERLAKCKH